jgi:hypothetical protein
MAEPVVDPGMRLITKPGANQLILSSASSGISRASISIIAGSRRAAPL